MKIAVLGPCDLAPFRDFFDDPDTLPPTYSFPYIATLVSAYLSRGHEVEIITSSEHIQTPYRRRGDNGLGLSVVPRRSRARQRALDLFAFESSWLAQATQQAGPDVVHAHWIYEFASGALSAQPDALITAHDAPISVVRHYGRHPYWWFREILGVRNLCRARNLTAVAPSLAAELRFFVPRNLSIDVIPNGLQGLNTIAEANRNGIQVHSRPSFAVVSNGFDRRKNSSTALLAFHHVQRVLPDSMMHMFGAGHEENGDAHRWARERGISGNIQYHGPTPHAALQDFLRHSVDVVVHPSRWEACSLAILEARSMGIPVIGSRSAGGVSFTLDEGESGFLVAEGPASYAKAMLDLVSDATTYAKKSRQAVDGLSPAFDMSHVADAYLQRLQLIVASR